MVLLVVKFMLISLATMNILWVIVTISTLRLSEMSHPTIAYSFVNPILLGEDFCIVVLLRMWRVTWLVTLTIYSISKVVPIFYFKDYQWFDAWCKTWPSLPKTFILVFWRYVWTNDILTEFKLINLIKLQLVNKGYWSRLRLLSLNNLCC